MEVSAIFLLAVCISAVSSTQSEVSLDGTNWFLSDSDGKVDRLQATVPGIVHLDLL